MSIHRRGILALLIASAWLVGCGTSSHELVDRYRPGCQRLRARLARIAEQLPTAGTVQEQRAVGLSPPLVFVAHDPATNCDGVMASQLTGDEPGQLDLMLGGDVVTALYWAEHPPERGDPELMRRTFESALRVRYLVVHRVDERQLPKAVDSEAFTGGPVMIEGMVFDLESGAVVASYVVEASPDETVYYETREGESASMRLEAGAKSTVWSSARQVIESRLAACTGGSVSLP